MGLKPGYKQTEVGVIPDDWEFKALGALSAVYRGASPRPIDSPIWFDEKSTVGWVRISDVTQSNRRLLETTQRLSEIGIRHSRFVPKGSLVMSICATVGRPIITDIDVCIHDGFVVFERPQINQDFLYYVLKALESSWSKHGQTGSQMNLNTGIINPTKILLPPTKAEQEAIAEALSDADALIESLKQLIAKKCHLKQGVMQELFTGKKRLTGFNQGKRTIRPSKFGMMPADWLPTSLEGVAAFITKGSTPTTYGFAWQNEGVLFLRSECVSERGLDLSQSMFISEAAHEVLRRSEVRASDILMTITGNVGRVVHLGSDFCGANINQHIARIRIVDEQVAAPFVFHFLSQPVVRRYYNLITTGQAYPQISLKQVRETEVPLPSFPEQIAIAAILSDMDAEIAALEEKLAKARSLKQGMMQELLTGKIRLVPAASKVIPFPGKNESVTASTKSHNWQIHEAVIIAVLAKHFGSVKYPLARKRCTKLTYLLHRHVERKAEGYLKKAAGPYNPATKYKGPEAIAQKNGYIRQHHNGTYPGFVAADNIAQAEAYFQQWYGPDVLVWLEQFRWKKTDELELLATVDMAMEDLSREGKPVALDTAKLVIRDHPEWEAKLQREIFSDDNIVRAIAECQALFGS